MKIIKGNTFQDSRGEVHFINDFDLSPVKRFYKILHPKTDVIRAWQVHELESKWFQCVKGAFLIQIADLTTHKVKQVQLSAERTEVLFIPKGNANGFKALMPESELLVFSDLDLKEALEDNKKLEIGTFKETWV